MRLRIELELDSGRIVGASVPIIVSGTPEREVHDAAKRIIRDVCAAAEDEWKRRR